VAAQAHRRPEAQLGRGPQGLEDADQAEGGAAVGDEVDLVAVGTQVLRDVVEWLGSGGAEVTGVTLLLLRSHSNTMVLCEVNVLFLMYCEVNALFTN
jgi:hypothetical protein